MERVQGYQLEGIDGGRKWLEEGFFGVIMNWGRFIRGLGFDGMGFWTRLDLVWWFKGDWLVAAKCWLEGRRGGEKER